MNLEDKKYLDDRLEEALMASANMHVEDKIEMVWELVLIVAKLAGIDPQLLGRAMPGDHTEYKEKFTIAHSKAVDKGVEKLKNEFDRYINEDND
jgi:hypothetical protein